jgi:hypothetical protein
MYTLKVGAAVLDVIVIGLWTPKERSKKLLIESAEVALWHSAQSEGRLDNLHQIKFFFSNASLPF